MRREEECSEYLGLAKVRWSIYVDWSQFNSVNGIQELRISSERVAGASFLLVRGPQSWLLLLCSEIHKSVHNLGKEETTLGQIFQWLNLKCQSTQSLYYNLMCNVLAVLGRKTIHCNIRQMEATNLKDAAVFVFGASFGCKVWLPRNSGSESVFGIQLDVSSKMEVGDSGSAELVKEKKMPEEKAGDGSELSNAKYT